MSTKNVPGAKPVNKVIERVKEQDERNNTLTTEARWPAQGGMFARVNRNTPDNNEPPAETPAVVVRSR